MKNIGDFFKRFNSLKANELARREVVVTAIKQFTDIDLSVNNISFSSNIIRLTGIPHIAKSVVYTKKQQIIERINEKLTNQKITNIS